MVTIVSAIADGTRASQSVQAMTGQVKVGGPASTFPSTETPAFWASVSTTAMVPTMRTISAHGTAAASRRPTRSTRSAPSEMTSDQMLSFGRPVIRPPSFSRNSPPLSIFTPSIFAACDTRMSSARPPTKPIRMGFERKFARNPSLKNEQSRKSTPPMRACASARTM